VNSLDPELRRLYDEGLIDSVTATRTVAIERGEVFSVYAELRLVLYTGVLLVTAGVGTLLARNLDRIGPLAIVLALALIAAACAVPAVRARIAGRPVSQVADYLLLLCALLLSADVAYAEHAFGLLGTAWSWHLLLLAVVHAAVAYAFGSTLVLAAALSALAGWFGVGLTSHDVPWFDVSTPGLGARALLCAAFVVAWRLTDRSRRPTTNFTDVFDHFATNLAFGGVLAWCYPVPWVYAGLPLLGIIATLSIRRGLQAGRTAFVVYGVLYAALGLGIAIVPRVGGDVASLTVALLIVIAAAVALWRLYQRVRESSP
jgi:hypothetical protein